MEHVKTFVVTTETKSEMNQNILKYDIEYEEGDNLIKVIVEDYVDNITKLN